MKPFPVARYLRNRNRRRSSSRKRTHMITASAALALTLPVAALVAGPSANAATSSTNGTAAKTAATTTAKTTKTKTAATTPSTASCPWLNQSLSVQQRVKLLMAQMTLAQKISMMTGAGFSTQYVFETAAIPSLCIPAIGEEDGPLGV